MRPEAAHAVKMCKQAGIKIVMVTGDHINTACAIAKELGIMRSGDLAISGFELAGISQRQLERDIFIFRICKNYTRG